MTNFDNLVKKILTEDVIPGGKSSGMTISDIAKKHNVSITQIQQQLKMGMKIELEHTPDHKKAKEIAMDHLEEFPNYYSELAKAEDKMKKQVKEANVAGGTGSAFAHGPTPANIGEFGGHFGNVDFYGTGDARLPRVLTPMMRRTFPELITKGKKKKKKKKKKSD